MLLPNDETLMAYADGELDPKVANAVEAALLENPRLVLRIVDFVRSRRLARGALESLTLPEPQADLVAAAREQVPAATRRHARARFAIAASIALVASGLAGGAVYLSTMGDDAKGFAALETPDFVSALGETMTGETAEIPSGRLRAVATLELEDRSLCREVEFTTRSELLAAVVCRGENMAWRPVLALAGRLPDQTYAPAGESGLIDQFFRQRGAGPALTGEAEARAVRGAETKTRS